MQEALKQAKIAFEKDEVPVGAVIVFNNKIIAKAHNQVETLKDPTAHAEMIAITQATATLGSKWLLDCIAYVTLEPCIMCIGAIFHARINRLVFATRDFKAGAAGSAFNLLNSYPLYYKIAIDEGIMQQECAALLLEFFANKR